MVKTPPANAGDIRDVGSTLGWGKIPGGGQGNLLQYSYLENPMDRGARGATVYRVAKSQTRMEGLSTAHSDVMKADSSLSLFICPSKDPRSTS